LITQSSNLNVPRGFNQHQPLDQVTLALG